MRWEDAVDAYARREMPEDVEGRHEIHVSLVSALH